MPSLLLILLLINHVLKKKKKKEKDVGIDAGQLFYKHSICTDTLYIIFTILLLIIIIAS